RRLPRRRAPAAAVRLAPRAVTDPAGLRPRRILVAGSADRLGADPARQQPPLGLGDPRIRNFYRRTALACRICAARGSTWRRSWHRPPRGPARPGAACRLAALPAL